MTDTATYQQRVQIAAKLAMLRAATILAQHRDGIETALEIAQHAEPDHARIIHSALAFLTEVENDLARQGKSM